MINKPEKQIQVVAGPTGAGKTSYAIELAQKINGELISADSRQIYKYLDIGTNKGDVESVGEVVYGNLGSYPLFRDIDSKINIHLLSFLNPDQPFSVAEFQKLAFAAIEYIFAQGKVPILVGGTGLYIASVINPDNFQFDNSELNTEYRNYLNTLSREELINLVKDSQLYAELNASDKLNPRRLIRVAEKLKNIKQIANQDYPQYEVVKHYIDKPLTELDEILRNRIDEMWNKGLVWEVKNVLKMGYIAEAPGLHAPGYKEVLSFLQEELTTEQAKELTYFAHRHYAKRQRTWFNKYFA